MFDRMMLLFTEGVSDSHDENCVAFRVSTRKISEKNGDF